jgi:hypothetical protein
MHFSKASSRHVGSGQMSRGFRPFDFNFKLQAPSSTLHFSATALDFYHFAIPFYMISKTLASGNGHNRPADLSAELLVWVCAVRYLSFITVQSPK